MFATYFTCITVVSHLYYACITVILYNIHVSQLCYECITVVSQLYYVYNKVILYMYQRCITYVLRLYNSCITVVLRLHHSCITHVFYKDYTCKNSCITQVFQLCYKCIILVIFLYPSCVTHALQSISKSFKSIYRGFHYSFNSTLLIEQHRTKSAHIVMTQYYVAVKYVFLIIITSVMYMHLRFCM